jgi:hypothetical protein
MADQLNRYCLLTVTEHGAMETGFTNLVDAMFAKDHTCMLLNRNGIRWKAVLYDAANPDKSHVHVLWKSSNMTLPITINMASLANDNQPQHV